MIRELFLLIISTVFALVLIAVTQRIVFIGMLLIGVIVSIYLSRYYKDKRRLNDQRKILDYNNTVMTFKHQQQSTQLEVVVANLEIPVLLINDEGMITIINDAAKKMIDVDYQDGMSFQALLKDAPDLLSIVDQGYLYEKGFVQPLNYKEHAYQVLFSPMVIQKQFHGGAFIFQDVTVLKQIEITQKQFIADASHELKTPMSAIIGSLNILKHDGFDQREVFEDFMGILIKEVERMNDLINDLSELTKFSSPQVKMRFEYINIQELVGDIVSLYKTKADEKDVKLIYEYKGHKTAYIDKRKVQTILTNLISNAIRYTDAGYIHVFIECDDQLTMLVEDTGIGMTQAELDHIFERFYRVEKARSRDTGGTGLGLCIVESIVGKYKGILEVSSQVDRGTMFKVVLPIIEEVES